jgi:hypothetical protein
MEPMPRAKLGDLGRIRARWSWADFANGGVDMIRTDQNGLKSVHEWDKAGRRRQCRGVGKASGMRSGLSHRYSIDAAAQHDWSFWRRAARMIISDLVACLVNN